MMLAAQIACGFVAVQHVGILILEMFLWRKPIGMKIFGLKSQALADESAPLAMNQGLYNGFLAAGLFWALLTPWAARGGLAGAVADATAHASGTIDGRCVGLFFLGCVVVAGIFGGITAKRSIIVVQGLPAAIGFGLTWFAAPS